MTARSLILEQDSANESRLYLFGPDLPDNGYRVTSRGYTGVFDDLKKRTANHPVLRSLTAMDQKRALAALVKNGYTLAIQYMPGAYDGRYGDGIVIAAHEPVKLPENVIRNFNLEAITPVFYYNGEKTTRMPYKEYLGQNLTKDEQSIWDTVEMTMGEMPPTGVGYTPEPGAKYHEPDAQPDQPEGGYEERHTPTVRAEEFPENQPKPPQPEPEPEPEPSRIIPDTERRVRSTAKFESAAQIVRRMLD